MKKLPENISFLNEDGIVMSQPYAEWRRQLIKSNKVKPLKNDDGHEVRSANDIVDVLFKSHLNDSEGTFELPDEMNSYSDISDVIKDQVAAHNEAVVVLKQQKDTEKQQKQADREKLKAEKEAEDKEFQAAQQEFADFILKMSEKTKKRIQENFDSAVKSIKLPATIAVNENGMGLVISDSATKQDITQAVASVLGGMEGANKMKSAMQFMVGDLMNAGIKAKLFRTKGDAGSAIKTLVLDKLNKNLESGAIQFYALMAERVVPNKRHPDVQPSVYLSASKIVAPRDKSLTDERRKELEVKFDKAREETIDLINSGELKSIKDVNNHVETFKRGQGLLMDKGPGLMEILRNFFLASWIKENITHENEVYKFHAGKDSPEFIEMTLEELSSRLEDAKNQLQNMLITGRGYDVTALIKGTIKKGKGDKTEEVPYLFVDPFDMVEEDKK